MTFKSGWGCVKRRSPELDDAGTGEGEGAAKEKPLSAGCYGEQGGSRGRSEEGGDAAGQ